MKFQNDIVMITGGSNGIGQGLAKAYSDQGATVIILDLDERKGRELVDTLPSKAYFYFCDLRNPDQIQRTIQKLEMEIGIPTILINNAGISTFKDFFSLTVEDWENVIQTNLRSVFLCSQELAKRWKDLNIHGRIVNMASTRAFMSEPNTEAYSSSKGGIFSLTHALSMTLSPYHIRVNSISPGWIETRQYDGLRPIDHSQHPSLRVGRPEDVAKASFYLTDPENTFVTGENIVVDGGMTKKMIYEH
ncbi:SDR family oxidoreductase [Bacillaceae bacterium S4-13-58]